MYVCICIYVYIFIICALRPLASVGCLLAFTRDSFAPKLYSTIQSSLYCPLHLHCSHYCNTSARRMRNIRPPPDPPCVCNTPYDIGSGNIVYRPSCLVEKWK